MLEIKTGVFVGLSINNQDYPLEENGFQKLVMVSNGRMGIPTCEIVFSDMTRRINKDITLADGVPLVLKVGRSLNDHVVYKFRVASVKRDPSNNTPTYIVYGYLDHPKWFVDSWLRPIRNTSAGAISELAAASGLKPEVDQTNDSMVWLGSNQRTAVMARQIARRGFINDKSIMTLGVTLDGRCLYKDLSSLPTKGETFAPGRDPQHLTVLDFRTLAQPMYNNMIGGYSATMHTQPFQGNGEAISQMDVKRRTQDLQMNKDVKTAVTRGRHFFGNLQAGNYHPYWDKALYQNMRGAMVYSTGIELLTDKQTETSLDLLSPIHYEAYETPTAGSAEIAGQDRGVYYVTAKSIFLQMGLYVEKFQAYTTGLNVDGDGKQSQV